MQTRMKDVNIKFTQYKKGDIITGSIVMITKRGAIVNIGGMKDGIVPIDEVDTVYKEGDAILVMITDKVDEYGKINTTIGTGRIVGFEEKYDTNIKNVTASFASKDGVLISFYKKEEFSDGTYLYYLVENNNKSQSHKIELKKLLINGKIYEDAEVNVNTHYSSKTIFYIKIPHKDFSDIITIKSSFFILRADEKEQTIFATNDLLIDYSKDETK